MSTIRKHWHWIVLGIVIAVITYTVKAGVTWRDVYDFLRTFDDVLSGANWTAWFMFMLVLVVLVAILRAHLSPSNDFDLFDLVSRPKWDEEKKRIVKKVDDDKFMRFGAFIVSTAGFWYLVINKAMTEYYFGLYMAAWVGNAIWGRSIKSKEIIAKNGDSEIPYPGTNVSPSQNVVTPPAPPPSPTGVEATVSKGAENTAERN